MPTVIRSFMRIKVLFPLLFTLLGAMPVSAQRDVDETVRWVEQQALLIDSVLNQTLRGQNAMLVIAAMSQCYVRFDAITAVGLYCAAARAAAEKGKDLCDFVNYQMETDPAALFVRGSLARTEARRLLQGIQSCREINSKNKGVAAYTPMDVIRADLEMVALDLTDGLASDDFHIMAQKTEHAIRLLYEMEHIAISLAHCSALRYLVVDLKVHAKKVIDAASWDVVKIEVTQALEVIGQIRRNNCNQ
jgi:hypothetical protein